MKNEAFAILDIKYQYTNIPVNKYIIISWEP